MLKGFIYTLYQTLLKKPDSCFKSVVSLIMNYDNFNPTAAKTWFGYGNNAKQK